MVRAYPQLWIPQSSFSIRMNNGTFLQSMLLIFWNELGMAGIRLVELRMELLLYKYVLLP